MSSGLPEWPKCQKKNKRSEVNSSAYYFAGPINDWTAPQNDMLWQDGMKTLFDPCPAGWRVPKSGEQGSGKSPWDAFTMDNGPLQGAGSQSGRLFDNSVARLVATWYPLTGRRNYTSGMFTALAGSGYSYTSTALSGKAHYFGLYTFAVSPWAGVGLNGRAEGFPVRCVRE